MRNVKEKKSKWLKVATMVKSDKVAFRISTFSVTKIAKTYSNEGNAKG